MRINVSINHCLIVTCLLLNVRTTAATLVVSKLKNTACMHCSVTSSSRYLVFVVFLTFYLYMGTLEPQSNGPLYSNTVIGTLALIDGLLHFVQRRGAGAASSLYQM